MATSPGGADTSRMQAAAERTEQARQDAAAAERSAYGAWQDAYGAYQDAAEEASPGMPGCRPSPDLGRPAGRGLQTVTGRSPCSTESEQDTRSSW